MRKSIKINAALNVTKQIMQILFPIITVPYITRVLLPENYGKINFCSSIISYLMLVAGLGIATYAVREGAILRTQQNNFNSFCSQMLSINMLSTVIAYVIFAFLLIYVPYFADYKILLIIQSIAVLFTTMGMDWVNSVEEDYLYITVRYIILQIISLILLFLFVKAPDDYYVYAVIMLVTPVGANILNLIYIRRYVKIRLTLSVDWKRHFVPIMVLFGNAIAMTFYVSSDITMLGIFKGDMEVGVYSVAAKIYAVVKQILYAMVIVTIPKLTAYMGKGDMEAFQSLGNRIFNTMITAMCPLILGIIIFREEVIVLVAGKEYLLGVASLFILTLAVVASLLATFFASCVLMPLRMEKYILKGTTIAALINVILNYFFIPKLGADGAAMTTLLSEIYVAVYFIYLSRKSGYHFLNVRTAFLAVLGSILVALLSELIKSQLVSPVVYMCVSIIASAVIYTSLQIVGKNFIMLDLLHKKNK